ncbi:hypothetical protein PLUTO_00400 [Luteibacter phage vB_LflM-Pluto]|uniref:Uncharacterized protein n=1 Tax=Luteibacter phage vB_LflM-Pluto TaxID=2948611 RepID=A0A9E7MV91_9CAUD|nr:hypothetical protein PLUTO_00400 [Luteibacter phage vB_LflM-Pluto]
MKIRAIIYASVADFKRGKVLHSYTLDNADRQQRRRLGEQAKDALAAGQVVVTHKENAA